MGSLRYQPRPATPTSANRERLAVPKQGRTSAGTAMPLYLQTQSLAGLEQQAEAAEAPFAAADESNVQAVTGGVPLHHDAAANRAAQAQGAQALTVGGAVIFNEGQYSPSSAAGRALIGHELAHVQQQAGQASGVQRKTLADAPAADRKKLEVPSTSITLSQETLDSYFENLGGDRWGTKIEAPGKVTVELDGIPEAFRTPVTSIAMHMYSTLSYPSTVTGVTKPVFGPGQTVTLFLPLKKYKLADANFRFTWTGTASQGVIYIEA